MNSSECQQSRVKKQGMHATKALKSIVSLHKRKILWVLE